MANRWQKYLKNEAAKELAQKKKSAGGDYRQMSPSRTNSPKDFSRNRNAPGFRKPVKAEQPTLVKVYKEKELA